MLFRSGWALFILMMDPSKAFDFIIQEVIVGLSLGTYTKTEVARRKIIEGHLRGLDISDVTRDYVTKYLTQWDGVVEKLDLPRSEERRVGKECRYRWSPSH